MTIETITAEQLARLRELHAAEEERARNSECVPVMHVQGETFAALLATCEAHLRLVSRRFPVLQGGMSVPWQMLVPHEPQAQENHDQSLKRLAERGGLSWAELLCVLEGRRWKHGGELTDEQAKPRVLELVARYESRPLDPTDTAKKGG